MKLTTIREIQEVLLEDYITVSKLWDKHHYYYVFMGGSILGAVRHKGFIPWDDDLDVGLARKDYEDFAKRTSKELPDYLKIYYRKKIGQYLIMDTRYEVDYNEQNLDALFDGESGVAHPTLDLQVFDGTPNNPVLRFLFCMHVMGLRAYIKMGDPSKIHEEKWRPAWENLMIRFIKLFPKRSKKKTDKLLAKYTRLLKKYDFDKSEYIADFMGKYHLKDVYPKSWWSDLVDGDFENIKVPLPKGYRHYLTQVYGSDYMKIPKKSDRESHVN